MVQIYQQHKTEAREQAIEWQREFENQNYSWAELAAWAAHFERLGKRYGLLKEFHENGIL